MWKGVTEHPSVMDLPLYKKLLERSNETNALIDCYKE